MRIQNKKPAHQGCKPRMSVRDLASFRMARSSIALIWLVGPVSERLRGSSCCRACNSAGATCDQASKFEGFLHRWKGWKKKRYVFWGPAAELNQPVESRGRERFSQRIVDQKLCNAVQ